MKDVKIAGINLTVKPFIIITAVSVLILLLVLFLFSGNKKIKSNCSLAFLKVDVTYADTTLKYISDEGKAAQMIIADFGKIDSTKNDTLWFRSYCWHR